MICRDSSCQLLNWIAVEHNVIFAHIFFKQRDPLCPVSGFFLAGSPVKDARAVKGNAYLAPVAEQVHLRVVVRQQISGIAVSRSVLKAGLKRLQFRIDLRLGLFYAGFGSGAPADLIIRLQPDVSDLVKAGLILRILQKNNKAKIIYVSRIGLFSSERPFDVISGDFYESRPSMRA